MGSIKKHPLLIDKKCTQCYKPTHLKFNFSFISYMDDFTKEHKSCMMDRMIEISSEPYLVVSGWRKELGFEIVKLNISKQIKKEFFEGNNRTFDGKYAVIRLYKNNNPSPSRIIGKIIHNIFYVFFIDIKGDLYKH